MCMGCAALVEEFERATVEDDGGRTRRLCDDLRILPRDAVCPSRAESFQSRFFGGESRGVVLRGDSCAATVAVGAFG